MDSGPHPHPGDGRCGGSPSRAGRGRPFVVPVATLRKHVGSTRRVSVEGELEGLGALGVVVPEGSAVRAELELCSDPGGITVTGTVGGPWVGECRRCGGPVSGRATAAVRERVVPAAAVGEDDDSYRMEEDELDLEPLVRDAVLLELPLAPLCSDTCLGLCPECGTNWNESPCDCRPAADPRWASLDELREPPG